MQHAAELRRQEALNASAVLTQKLSQHRQGGITFACSERETPVKGGVPVRHHGAAPLVIEAGRRRLKHGFPGLGQRLHKHRAAKAAPLLAKACGNQAAVLLCVGQVHAFPLEHGLRQGLHHLLRVGGAGHLLQTQTHAGDAGQIRLQAQGGVSRHDVAAFVFTHQRE
ncbi:hypothetical protein D3C85_1125250 [compost metagenome]